MSDFEKRGNSGLGLKEENGAVLAHVPPALQAA
jgi:hypothetical protein